MSSVNFLMYNHKFKFSCFKEEFLSSYGEAKRRRCSMRLRDISDREVPVQNQDLETSLDPVLARPPGAGVNKPEETLTPLLSTEDKLFLDSKPEVGGKRSEVSESNSDDQFEDKDTKDESENDDDESLDEEDEEEDDLLQQLGILSILFL